MQVSLSRFTGFFSGFKPIEKISETVKPFLTKKVAALAHLAFGALAMLYNQPNAGVLLLAIGTAIVIHESNILIRLATLLSGIFRFFKPSSAKSALKTPSDKTPESTPAPNDSAKAKSPRSKKSSDSLNRSGSSHHIKHRRLKKSERTPSSIKIDESSPELKKAKIIRKPKRSMSQKLIHALHLDNTSEAPKHDW